MFPTIDHEMYYVILVYIFVNTTPNLMIIYHWKPTFICALLSISGKLVEEINAHKSNSKMKSLYLNEYYLDCPWMVVGLILRTSIVSEVLSHPNSDLE
jgi:hypothetical protein